MEPKWDFSFFSFHGNRKGNKSISIRYIGNISEMEFSLVPSSRVKTSVKSYTKSAFWRRSPGSNRTERLPSSSTGSTLTLLALHGTLSSLFREFGNGSDIAARKIKCSGGRRFIAMRKLDLIVADDVSHRTLISSRREGGFRYQNALTLVEEEKWPPLSSY